jgi:cell division protein FtsB
MRWLVFVLGAVVLLTQYRLWASPDGVRESMQLEDAVTAQRTENERLKARNGQLAAEVRDLKQGFNALEERARSDLGMIAANETFYQVVPRSAVAQAPAPAAVTPNAAARPTSAH